MGPYRLAVGSHARPYGGGVPALPRRHHPLLLELDLTELPAAPDPDDPVARLRARGRRELRPTLRALHEAGEDPRVVGLVAKVGGGLPWASMQELRDGVAAFGRSGKPCVAWAESFGEGSTDTAAYVLATAFDQIWLQPSGSVGLLGVGVEVTFLAGVLERIGLEPQIEQRHEYKNAPDQLTRSSFTAAHREALERLAASLFTSAVEAIAAARRLDPDRVRELADTGPRTAEEAQTAGLVDRLGYRDQVYAELRARVDSDAELRFADRWSPPRRLRRPARGRDHVGLIEVRGAIATGRTRRGLGGRVVGSDSVGAQLRAATEADRVRAVVLRIDSPGGSAVASDTIWREVCRVREAGKPVVVSMGAVAASGGYFVACPATVILALPATLTGSIGVFGGKVVARDLLDRLGLATGTVKQGERALMFSARRGFDPGERDRLAAALDAIYDDFVAKVAQGRGRTVSEIETVARGRVWTGEDGMKAGLVDRLGGLRDAIAIARERADLPADAPVLPALHVPPLARFGRAKNSEDPRAVLGRSVAGGALSGGAGAAHGLSEGVLGAVESDLMAARGLPAGGGVLRMPSIVLR